MERIWPACRRARHGTERIGAHGPHEFFPSEWADASKCPGWDEGSADASAMVDRLEDVAREWRLDGEQPPGAKVECHPLVLMHLHRITLPSYTEFVNGQDSPPCLFSVPVVVTAGVDRGAWRLASDNGVLADGALRG